MKRQVFRPAIAALPAFAGLLAFAGLPAFADGDASLGKKTFSVACMACHDPVSAVDRVGPHLSGVVGRTAGTAGSYLGKYSPAMKAAGAAGLVWDEANLADYLRSPKVKVPGNSMAFSGLKREADVDNVIAYLKADPKP
jgi:cytochrome c